MPWDCPNQTCKAHVPFDDVLACPECGTAKTAWSLADDQTRTLVLAKRRQLELRRGEGFAAGTGSSAPHLGVAWVETGEASVLTKAEVQELMDRGALPDPKHRIDVWAFPGKKKRWELEVSVPFERRPVADHAFTFEPSPDRLGAEGLLEVQLLCVHGPEPMEGLSLPDVTLIDVTDDTPLGHAPKLEVRGFRSPTRTVLLRAAVPVEVTCFRGASPEPVADASAFDAATWEETTFARAVPMVHVRTLLSRGQLPAPSDVLTVRLDPKEVNAPRLTVDPRGTQDEEDVEVAVDGFEVRLLFAYDEDEGVAVELPGLHVIDVTDLGSVEGFAPRVDLSCLGGPVTDLALVATRPFEVELVNRLGQPVPLARVQLVFADGTERDAEVDAEGRLRIDDAPFGEVDVVLPDPDDLVAKAEAGRASRAIGEANRDGVAVALRHPPPLGPRIADAYAAHFNDHSGQGLVEDIYATFTDPDDLLHLELILGLAGLEPRATQLGELEEQEREKLADDDEDLYGDIDADDSFDTGEADEDEDIYAEFDVESGE